MNILSHALLWVPAVTGFAAFQMASAQEPRGPEIPFTNFQTTVVQGRVAQYLMSPDEFVDGLLLSDNTIILLEGKNLAAPATEQAMNTDAVLKPRLSVLPQAK